MVGLPLQYCHEHKLKLLQLLLRAVLNLEATCSENRFRRISLQTFSNKNRFEATQYLLLSGFLNDDGHPIGKLQKNGKKWLSNFSFACQVYSATLHCVFTS